MKQKDEENYHFPKTAKQKLKNEIKRRGKVSWESIQSGIVDENNEGILEGLRLALKILQG